MQAWIACDEDIAVDECPWLSILIMGDADLTFPFLQDTPSIAYAKQHARLGEEDTTFLLLAVVE